MKLQAQLSWVIVDGQQHHVSEYANMTPTHRPQSYCPVCGREVVMRLGEQRVFHAAHKPNDACPVTHPETALHLNAKLHLAQQLNLFNPLFIRIPCGGLTGENCPYKNQVDITICQGWDKVQVEYQIDQYRPDIVLLSGERTVGAVEVFVTHAIEPEKELYLKKLNIPFVEVDANAVFPSNGISKGWTAEEPMPYRSVSESLKIDFLCPKCDLNQRTKIIEKWFRVIDVYKDHGLSVRVVFIWKDRVFDGKVIKTYILGKIGGEKDQCICEIDKPELDKDKAYYALMKMFDDKLTFYKSQAIEVDEHMKWQSGSIGVVYDYFLDYRLSSHTKFPERYYWEKFSHSWKVNPAFRNLKWNLYFSDREAYTSELRRMRKLNEKLLKF